VQEDLVSRRASALTSKVQIGVRMDGNFRVL